MSTSPETDPLTNPMTHEHAWIMAHTGHQDRCSAAGYRAISAFVRIYPETVLDIDNAMPNGEEFEASSLGAVIEQKLETDQAYDAVAEIKETIAYALVATPPSESFIKEFFRFFPKKNLTDQISVIYGTYETSLVDIFDQEQELSSTEDIQAMSVRKAMQELVYMANDNEPYEHSAETLKEIQIKTVRDALDALDELGSTPRKTDKTARQLLQEITSTALSSYQDYQDKASYVYNAVISGEAATYVSPSKKAS